MKIFFFLIPLISIVLLTINLIGAPVNSYKEKDSMFECGYHSFLGQNRIPFTISFFLFALLFLLFDLEILLVYPYTVSSYHNAIYGLIIMLIFLLLLTLGFIYELGKNALNIESRQMLSWWKTILDYIKNHFGLEQEQEQGQEQRQEQKQKTFYIKFKIATKRSEIKTKRTFCSTSKKNVLFYTS